MSFYLVDITPNVYQKQYFYLIKMSGFKTYKNVRFRNHRKKTQQI